VGKNTLGLGPFLQQLEECLAARSGEELRAILLDHAARLPDRERAGFLAIFEQPTERASGPTAADVGNESLFEDVEVFVADIEKGVYVEGCGYDPEYRDHRAFGDETWTIEFDCLAERAGLALLVGDASIARDAYRRLLLALLGEYDEGGFPGAGLPAELVDTDIGEAKHRYLRAVWESEPVQTRAAAVVAAAAELAYLDGDVCLAALEETRREPLPDLDAVLPDLVAQLRAVPTGYGFGTQARRLLAEVTERCGGVDGLAKLARAPGEQQAEAYRDWIDALVRAERFDEAEAAATEALERLDLHGGTVAAVAKRLALLAAARADDAVVLAARRAAWRAHPTLTSLLDLVDVATVLDRQAEVVAAEADRPADGPLGQRLALAAALLLLAGRVDAAVELLEPAQPHYWDLHRGPAPVVVPFLLVGASNAHHDQRWEQMLLFELLDQANSADWRYDYPESDDGLDILRRAVSVDPRSGSGERYRAIPRGQSLLSTVFIDALEATSPGSAERHRWLHTARSHVDSQIDTVVGGKHRSAYVRVAHLAAACAEALMLAVDARAAHKYLDDLHGRYPRHSSFRGELRTILVASPLLDA